MKRFLATMLSLAFLVGAAGTGATAQEIPSVKPIVLTAEKDPKGTGALTVQKIREEGLAPDTVSDEEIKAALAETHSHQIGDMLFHPPDLHDDPKFVKWDHFRPWFNFCGGPWSDTGHGWRSCIPLEWYPHLDVLYMNDNPNGTLNYGTKLPSYPYFDAEDGSIIYIRDNNTGVIKKFQHIGLFCTPWWGCSNAYGDPSDMWGEWIVDEWPLDDQESLSKIVVNGSTRDLEIPIKEMDSRPYMPFHPQAFSTLGYTVMEGRQSPQYLLFARGRFDTTAYTFGIWKEADAHQGFVMMDGAPTEKFVDVYPDVSGHYYVDLRGLQDQGLLGATRIEKVQGIWNVDIALDEDVPDWQEPWLSGYIRHGYDTDPDVQVEPPVNQFLFTEWYRMVLGDPAYRAMYSIESGPLGILGHIDYLIRTELMYPKRANGLWWGSTFPKYDLVETGSRLVWFPAPEKQNMETIRWAKANYSTMDALWNDFSDETTAYVNGIFLGMGLRAGASLVSWWANPVRNLIFQRVVEREVAVMIQKGAEISDDLINAAIRQRLGYGYQILYGSPNATSPGNGTYAVIRYVSDTKKAAMDFQCMSMNCPLMQEIQGFGGKNGKFYIILEQGLYKNGPFFDRLSYIQGQPRIIDAKFGYEAMFADYSKGVLKKPDQVFGNMMNGLITQLERNIAISKEYGMGKPVIVSNNAKAIEGISKWMQANRPDLVGKYEIMQPLPSTGRHWLPPLPPPDHPAIIIP